MSLPINPSFVATTDELSGYRIVRNLGVAEGISVAVFTGFLTGGQKKVLLQAIQEAFTEMLESAARQGAHAIVGLRYATPSSGDERIIMAYGTAVLIEKL